MKNGFGEWRASVLGKCNSYEGQYFMDKKHGKGVFTWASGNTYSGFFKDDLRHGRGEMKWADGSKYVGLWFKGI